MANNTLETRILICNDTTANWGTSAKVLLKGEVGIEFPESGAPKLKVGNGTDVWADLPYITLNPTEINQLLSGLNDAKHSHNNKSVLDATTSSFTTALKEKLDGITASADSVSFARSLTSGTKVGTITINGTGTDLYAPTNTNTTYDLGASASAANGNVKINLTGSNSTTDSVTVKGSGSVTVTSDANGAITVTGTDTKYTHPNSGVTAGTYKSVTVNAQGHVTGGTNPTTLAGYGITDAAAKSHQHGNADITAIDASKITTGTISIDRLPQGALERCVVVADDTARFALTTSNIQKGDTVKVTATGKMYFVVDDTKLSSEAGYEVYTAGSAASVPWSGVTGKPSTFTPSAHNQAISTITGLQAALDGKAANTDMTGASSSVTGTHGLVPAPAAGKQTSFLRGDGTWAVPTNTDTKVTNTLNTTAKAYVTGTTSATTNTGTQVFDTGVYLDTTAGTLTATTFKGTLSGNASSATKLATARTIALSGAATGTATSFNGSANISIPVTSLNAVNLTLSSSDTLIINGGNAS